MSMNLMMSINIHVSQSLSQVKSPPSPSILHNSHLQSSHNGFPIIAIAIIGIVATAFLLLGYYIFVIKCCLNWHRIDILGRFSLSRNRHHEDPLMGYTPTIENRGLDESVIHSIPTFKFKKAEKEDPEKGISACECAVCLTEFYEQEKLRMIPNCGHFFHIDCIDVWLQNNANCPLCRTSISLATPSQLLDQVIAPTTTSSAHQDQVQYNDTLVGHEEDCVVIELFEENYTDGSLARHQEKMIPAKKLGSKIAKKGSKKNVIFQSMGDECINSRIKDEILSVQPIRRSFSMDSANDQQLYLAVRKIVNQNTNDNSENESEIVSCSEACRSKIRRTFFSFGYHGRGSSRRAVSSVQLEQ